MFPVPRCPADGASSTVLSQTGTPPCWLSSSPAPNPLCCQGTSGEPQLPLEQHSPHPPQDSEAKALGPALDYWEGKTLRPGLLSSPYPTGTLKDLSKYFFQMSPVLSLPENLEKEISFISIQMGLCHLSSLAVVPARPCNLQIQSISPPSRQPTGRGKEAAGPKRLTLPQPTRVFGGGGPKRPLTAGGPPPMDFSHSSCVFHVVLLAPEPLLSSPRELGLRDSGTLVLKERLGAGACCTP